MLFFVLNVDRGRGKIHVNDQSHLDWAGHVGVGGLTDELVEQEVTADGLQDELVADDGHVVSVFGIEHVIGVVNDVVLMIPGDTW